MWQLQALTLLRRINVGTSVQLTISKVSLLNDRFDEDGSISPDNDVANNIADSPPTIEPEVIADGTNSPVHSSTHNSPVRSIPRDSPARPIPRKQCCLFLFYVLCVYLVYGVQ